MTSSIREELQEHYLNEESRLVRMEEEIKSLRKDISELKQSVDDIVTAWKAANFFLSLIKWVAGIGAGLVAILSIFKGIK